MEYLLLALLIIIVYIEVLPTISTFFEFIRSVLSVRIALLQQSLVHTQKDIEDVQAQMQPNQTQAIGFHDTPEPLYIEGEEDDE